jgi:predicted Rossmann fold flavoprotein
MSMIGVIGGGPAGMTAALEARKSGAEVLLFDANPGLGRKLLVTGSGRCNLTNTAVAASRYFCPDVTWLEVVLSEFGHADLLDYLHKLGILTHATADGWIYPVSESAAAVTEIFVSSLEVAGVRIIAGTRIGSIEKQGKIFRLKSDDSQSFELDRLVVACGGKAYPNLGSTGNLFPILEKLGHTIHPILPALAPILADMKPYHKLQGVRLDAQASLIEKRTKLGGTIGNLIFTEWGLNGPAVMDLSHLVSAYPHAELQLELDLIFNCKEELRALISERTTSSIPLRVMLGSALPTKVPPVVLGLAGLPADSLLKNMNPEQLKKVFHLLTHLPFRVKGVRGFEYCQVSSGGIALNEVDALGMQSRIVPDLFFAGEVLDVTGPCGGYNLQFAFSTGAIAGRACNKE